MTNGSTQCHCPHCGWWRQDQFYAVCVNWSRQTRWRVNMVADDNKSKYINMVADETRLTPWRLSQRGGLWKKRLHDEFQHAMAKRLSSSRVSAWWLMAIRPTQQNQLHGECHTLWRRDQNQLYGACWQSGWCQQDQPPWQVSTLLLMTIIIIMLVYLYCAAYTWMTMNESSPPCEERRITFNDDGQRVQLARPELPRHITLAYTGCYQLHPHSPSRHYYPRPIAGTNLPIPKGWIAWLAKADCTHITICQSLLHNWMQRHQKKMNLGCPVQDQLNTSEPTAPYIIGRELNLRKLPGRQWESNPQSSEQLQPMTIKTSASTETATTWPTLRKNSNASARMMANDNKTNSMVGGLIVKTNLLWKQNNMQINIGCGI